MNVPDGKPFLIDTLAIVGVGLIGGSFAAALKKAGVVRRVIGAGRRPENLQKARDLGLIEEAVTLPRAASESDLIFLATPVGSFESILAAMRPTLNPRAVITDGGSTKQDVIAAARAALGDQAKQFVPAHPMAGSHETGPAAAKADLYQGRRVILTPLAENRPDDINMVESLWRACGARLIRLDPAEHDAAMACISHLPHWLSSLYMQYVATGPQPELRMDIAAGGFRDFTRIAQSSPEMWRDIFIANRASILHEIAKFRLQLDRAEQALRDEDAQWLEHMLVEAAKARQGWSGA